MNSRNQVATLNSMSLQHDAFGRRTRNLQNTSFLFDGANTVQELAGSTPTANLISGGIDEIFARADSTGAFTPLKDGLGSTIALVDANGNLATQYAYDPFGNTTVSGATNANAFQYTGRENEGNGLYYYRARYYSPALHRFISEDPLGFRGSGPNWYAYAYNSPTNFVDPSGMAALLGPDGKECASIRACNLAGRKAAIKSWIANMNALCQARELICPYGIMGPVSYGPGALSANVMNGNIIFIGGGFGVGLAGGAEAGSIAELRQIAAPIIANSGIFECDTCADALAQAFSDAGYEVNIVEAEGGAFDTFYYEGQVISTAGYHVGIEVDGYVFDNMVNGQAISAWKNAITSSGSSPITFTSTPH